MDPLHYWAIPAWLIAICATSCASVIYWRKRDRGGLANVLPLCLFCITGCIETCVYVVGLDEGKSGTSAFEDFDSKSRVIGTGLLALQILIWIVSFVHCVWAMVMLTIREHGGRAGRAGRK